MNPEDIARVDIDELLMSAGFAIQDMSEFDRTAALGVAVREFVMRDGSKADYLIFVDGKACGVIEAKKSGISLSGVENQSNLSTRATQKRSILPICAMKHHVQGEFLPFISPSF